MSGGVVADLERLVALRHEARTLGFLPRQAKRSLLAGQHGSKLRGRGLDFEELRAYVPGDDVRTIDWRVTARSERPFVRVYREERDRSVLLVVDQRPTMFFGSGARMKSVGAAELAALVAWRVLAQGDRVGALVFGAERTWALAPGRGAARVHRLCESLVEATRELQKPRGAPARDAAEALREAERLAHHDELVVVISDFRDLSDGAHEIFERLRRHNDLLLVWVTDPLERELPDVGPARVSDGYEERTLDTADSQFRRRFSAEYEAERARFFDFAAGARAAGFELSTDDDVVSKLAAVLGRSGAA
jgi:uncharacterized protein (DUF58 family)